MSKLKFRAWDTRNEELVYSHKEDCFYVNTKGVLFMYAIPKSESGLETIYHKSYDVEQFTGIQDKNGLDVYEGDILRTYHFTNHYGKKEYLHHEVVWSDKYCGWQMLNCTSRDENDGSPQLFVYIQAGKDFEKVGNIHENPELIKGV